MRGLMIGLWFAAYALGYAIKISGRYSFKCQSGVICQNLYYYVVKIVVFLIIMIVFLLLARRYILLVAKCYKFWVRENEVNIHLIVEEHYERYIEQEGNKDYQMNPQTETECTVWVNSILSTYKVNNDM